MVRHDKIGKNGKNKRAPYSEGWKPPAREYPPLPTVDSPLADKVTAITVYIGPYLVPGEAERAARETYGVTYTRFVQAVGSLAHDPEVIEAKPRETRLMRELMQSRRDKRRAARERTGEDPLRLARKPPEPTLGAW